MNKTLLTIACFLACISIQAQTLYGTTYAGGNNSTTGTITKFIPSTNTLTVARFFDSYLAKPFYTKFIQASNGKLYGVTIGGGNHGQGAIFSFDPVSSALTDVYDFDITNGLGPYGSLVEASNGKLYGMTSGGGSNDIGVIFSFDPSSSTFTKLVDFDGSNGSSPFGSMIQAKDGKLYGMTYSGGNIDAGVIFSFDPSSSAYTKLKDFDNTNGASPVGDLIQANDGKLYGMTKLSGASGYGVIFSFDPASSDYTNLKNFDFTNGANPSGNLIQATDEKFYGMAEFGGTSESGVIFSFDPSASTYTKLKDFDVANGANPLGSFLQGADGKLYAMTLFGGNNGLGIIFSYDILNATITPLQSFDNANGASPAGSLTQAGDGKLYGLASAGGIGGYGVIFSFNTSASVYTKLKDLSISENGYNPTASLVQAQNGKLYGMTHSGGAIGAGVIFSLDPSSSVYSRVKDFDSANGSNPIGNLTLSNNGKLYGMTPSGGAVGLGVIFSYDPTSSIYTKLKDFDSANGGVPYGSLMQASDGKLYGTTSAGGSKNAGVIFSFDPTSSLYTRLYEFDGVNGSNPYSTLTQAADGKLYGLTLGGGSEGLGVIFSINPATLGYTKLLDFNGDNGSYPYGSLFKANDGKLYGMTAFKQGARSLGTIFSFDPASSVYSKLKDLDDASGSNPQGNFMQASDGKLYGMTSQGGSGGFGTIFSFDIAASTYTKLNDFDGTNGANPHWNSAFIEVSDCISKVTYYKDADKDGYGNPADSIQSCTQPAGYVTNNTDCDDTKTTVHPGATEICGNGVDDNCDGQVDEGCNTKPVLSINDVSVNESQGVAVLTVALSHAISKPVLVLYYTKDGTAISWGSHKDYFGKIGILTIAPGSLTATISIKISKDNIVEPREYFDVIFLASLNAVVTDRSGRVFISDDMLVTNSKIGFNPGMETKSSKNLAIKAIPNPASVQFNLALESNNKTEQINIKVMDIQGKLIETRNGLAPGQTLNIGCNYRPGSYLIQAIQGKQRKIITVIKIPE